MSTQKHLFRKMDFSYTNAGSDLKMYNKMSAVMPFTFKAEELCVVALNDKP